MSAGALGPGRAGDMTVPGMPVAGRGWPGGGRPVDRSRVTLLPSDGSRVTPLRSGPTPAAFVPAPRTGGPVPPPPAGRDRRPLLLAVVVALVAATTAGAVVALARPAPDAACAPGWSAAWLAGAQPLPTPAALVGGGTLRMVVYPQVAGSQVRLRLSNAAGRTPLAVGRVTAAEAGTGSALAGPARPVTFGGAAAVDIAPGADLLSDPVPLAVGAGAPLAISVHLPSPPPVLTGHAVALQTSWLAARTDAAGSVDGAAFATSTESWLVVTGVDVLAARPVRAVVAVGDSITDGVGSGSGENARWTDALAARLHGGMAVLNAGISRATLLADDAGAAPLARFDRDVAALPGAADVVLSIGTNDIAAGADAAAVEAGLSAYVDRARAADRRILLTTITPSTAGAHGTRLAVATRDAVNDWIRTRGREHADGVVDFAAAVADPADPARLAPAFDSGDGLHLSAAGYRALAAAVDVTALSGSPCLA